MREENHALYDALCRHAKLPLEEWRYLSVRLTHKNFKRGSFLVRAGDLSGDFYFILKGLVRSSYPNQSGRATIKSFARELEMTGPILAWLAREPSVLDICALENTETLAFPPRLIPDLLQRHPAWQAIVEGYVKALARKMEDRARSFLESAAEQRYLDFLSAEPALSNRLPLNQVAAYLGITDVSLSRLRRRLNLC